VKFTRVLAATLLFSALVVGAEARPIKLARQPDYHSGRIVFTYQGDLWLVNEDGTNARRLTVHTARDANPKFSPDGRWIAFSSNRYGNNDVFVIPAAGGEAKQLTFHSGGDVVVGWSRDSKRVLFSSARGRVFGGTPNLLEVPVGGGLEQPLATDWGVWASYSPDGKKLAFNRHPAVWSRKHYRGSYAADLWVMDVAAKTFQKLVDADTPDDMEPNNLWPMFGNGEIFFVSDRGTVAKAGSPEAMKSVSNIWKVPAAGGRAVQVTRHTSGSLYFPSISADGKTIVYEESFGLWKLDTASGRSTEVKIDIASDSKDNEFEIITYTGQADSYDLSPTTRRAVISIRGEIFTIATDRGDITRITNSYSRETSPSWSPDGKWIVYESDQSGRAEIWVIGADGKNARKLTDADTEKNAQSWSPDSKSFAYSASDKKLYVLDLATGQSRVVASGEAGAPQGAEFSPDGKWLAYAKADRDLRPHVWIVPAAGGEERMINDDGLFANASPRWTSDGKKLIFLGGYVQGGSATIRNNISVLYNVSLTKEERDPVSRDIDDEEAAAAADRAARPAGGARPGAAAETPEVKIDWDGLDRRIRQVTRLSDSVGGAVPSPDSRTYAFVSQADVDGRNVSILYTIAENGDQLRRITQSQPPAGDGEGPPGGGFGGGGISALQFSRDGRTIYFREGNGLWSAAVGGGGEGGGAPAGGAGQGAGGARRRVNFTARVEVDHGKERQQVFAEGWRIMKHRFYDPNMHGANWNAARATYEPLLEDVADVEELQNVMMMMIGELNASHTGVTGGGQPDRNPMQTRYPGFELEPDASGYYKVSHIYKDGPADVDFVKIKVGDYILALNETPLKSGDNYWKHYNLAPGRKMTFTVNSKPSADGAWTTKVEPAGGGAFGNWLYEKWVADRRVIVDKLSGGEIGYLHIRAMNAPSLARFERELSEYRFKKALIIDQRFNGGGGIDQELLRILQQRQYQYTRGRDSVTLTRPQRAYFGPLVVMQNERSASDAEVFPDGFRTLKLGKVVGINTLGAVIGTGAFQLMNGSSIRTPGTGLWNVSGQNLENYGVPPDVYVDNTPEDYLKGRDAQVEKAVEVLKEELRKLGPNKIPGRE
jgi:tricorn protease